MLPITFRCIVLLIFTSGLMSLQSCSRTTGTSEASPVASIPLPEEGTITVSNPDSEGLSVVTGAANAVPASAIIIAQISDPYSFNFDVPGVLKNLVSPAYATESLCSSDLPTCPDISSDSECQFTANEDGSFVFQVPTDAGAEITIGYLDTDNSCTETFYEEAFTIDESVLSLDIDVSSVAFQNYDEDWGIYLLGVNAGGFAQIAILDVTDDTISTPDIDGLSDTVGTPSQIFVDDFEAYAARFVALSTSENLYFTIYDEAAGTYSSLVTALDGGDNNSAIPNSLVVDFNAYTFTETEVATGGCSTIYTAGAGTYERALILKTIIGADDLYVLPNISGSGSDNSALSYAPNLSYVFLDTTYTIERYWGAVERNNYIYALAQMRYIDASQPLHDFVAVLKFSATQPFCDNSEFVIVDYVSIADDGEAVADYYITTFADGDDALENDYVVVLNIDEQILSFVDINSSLTAYSFETLSTYTGLTHTTYLAQGFLSSGLYGVFALADDSGGASALYYNTETEDLTTSIDLGALFTTLDPKGAYYNQTTGRVYLIDSGVADDFTTTVMSRDSSEIPQ